MELAGPGAALLAGMVTSLHCVGMCGPLACSACAPSTTCTACPSNCRKPASSTFSAAVYHSTRMLSYLAAGAAAGFLGERVSEVLLGGATTGMIWVFVLFFLAVVVGLDKRLRFPSPERWFGGVLAKVGGGGPVGRGAALGIFTPLLPCAPLYLVVAAAALSGSAFAGAALMLSFGLGTVPLLFLLQNRLAWLERRWSPRTIDLTRRGLALVCVILLLVRGTYSAVSGCPMCH